MFGRLPRIYRWRMVAVALVLSAGIGAWLAASTPLPLVAANGGLLGAVAGLAVAYALVHDFSRRRTPARARR